MPTTVKMGITGERGAGKTVLAKYIQMHLQTRFGIEAKRTQGDRHAPDVDRLEFETNHDLLHRIALATVR